LDLLPFEIENETKIESGSPFWETISQTENVCLRKNRNKETFQDILLVVLSIQHEMMMRASVPNHVCA
jgi:hypothetical protein